MGLISRVSSRTHGHPKMATGVMSNNLDTNNNSPKMLDQKSYPEEHLICKQLAHNELPQRKLGFLSAKSYLQENSKNKISNPESMNQIHDNLEKIWKGLFYMMWHSDKLEVQDKLAKDMSLIVKDMDTENCDYIVMYYSAFLLTMSREWQGLDRYRTSKFLRLVRLMLREALSIPHKNVVTEIIKTLSKKLLLNTSQKFINSLKYHIAEIWLEEWKVIQFNSELDEIELPKDQLRREVTSDEAKQFLDLWIDVVLFSD